MDSYQKFMRLIPGHSNFKIILIGRWYGPYIHILRCATEYFNFDISNAIKSSNRLEFNDLNGQHTVTFKVKRRMGIRNQPACIYSFAGNT